VEIFSARTNVKIHPANNRSESIGKIDGNQYTYLVSRQSWPAVTAF
jgi:hypothetical protein